jgi:hypothetical protein
MGNDDPRFLRTRLHGLSPQVKASIDGRLIQDHQFELKSRFRAAFSLRDLRPPLPRLASLRHAD